MDNKKEYVIIYSSKGEVTSYKFDINKKLWVEVESNENKRQTKDNI